MIYEGLSPVRELILSKAQTSASQNELVVVNIVTLVRHKFDVVFNEAEIHARHQISFGSMGLKFVLCQFTIVAIFISCM